MAAHLEFDIAQLIDVAADDDRRNAGWRTVFAHFDPRLRDFFHLRVDSEAALDELMSEIWRRVLLNIDKLESPKAAWTWMTTIGVNVLRDELRARRRTAKRNTELALEVANSADVAFLARVDEESPDADNEAIILARIAELPSEDRELIHMFAVEELPHDEIARRLGLSSAMASRQRLRRIRLAVRGDK
jgi:RNA polymerase sigma-70 factor (ECF subfamily)